LRLALERLNRPGEAAAAYQKSIDIDPNHFDVWFALGNISLARKDWEQAIKMYKTAIPLDRTEAVGLFNLSIALRQSGDFEGAVATATEAIKLKKDFKSFLILGNAYKSLGKEREADECFRCAALLKSL